MAVSELQTETAELKMSRSGTAEVGTAVAVAAGQVLTGIGAKK